RNWQTHPPKRLSEPFCSGWAVSLDSCLSRPISSGSYLSAGQVPADLPPNSKRKQNAPEVLKVCPRDCFVISTTRKYDGKSAIRIRRPNSEVTSNKKQLKARYRYSLRRTE